MSAVGAEGNINPEADHSFVIHKYVQPEIAPKDPNPAGDGHEVPEFSGTPIEGVTYRITQVTQYSKQKLDPLDPASWDFVSPYLQGLKDFDPKKTQIEFGSSFEKVTDAKGIAEFRDFPIGFYYVEEIDPGSNEILNLMKPFLVAIPMPDSKSAGNWLYNVHAYPKSAVGAASKTVDESGAFGLGDILKWTIATKVPFISAIDDFVRFEIIDTLPAEELRYVGHELQVLDEFGALATNITSPEHFAVEISEEGQVALKFTAAGRQALEGYQGGSIKLNISTRVQGTGKGDIVNTAVVRTNDAEIPVQAVSYWGAAEIVKYQTGTKILLDGAVFEVYKTKEAAEKRDTSNVVTINGESKFATVKDGSVSLRGLKVGQYYVVETRAPAGYIASTSIHELNVTRGGLTQLSVENSQQPFGALPQLGSLGLVLTILVGIVAVGGAVTVAVRERRGKQRVKS